MSGSLDHIAFLSQEVGPRPAGTEEEQQAALYIVEQLQKEAGLPAVIEDFNSESNEELLRAICASASLVFTVLAMFFPVIAFLAIVVAVIAAFLYTMEMLDKAPLSKIFVRGVSQNVVGKYEPHYSRESGGTRRRKIIVCANYDSGKVRPETNGALLGLLPVLQKAILGAMIFLPIFLLIKNIFFLHAEGAVAIVFNIITILVLLIVAVPVVLAVVHKVSPYNEAANCNAAGVAALIELAKRVSLETSTIQDETGSMDVLIHGEEAAYASGLVPEGAQLVYQASQMMPPEPVPQSEEERLAAAKMAIAAMSGKPATPQTKSVADNLVQIKEKPIEIPSDEEEEKVFRAETKEAFGTIPEETLQEAYENANGHSAFDAASQEDGQIADAAEVSTYISQEPVRTGSSVPDWFRKAQENAKKPKSDTAKVERSRYADALDAAVEESASHFTQANQAINAETAERLQKMRDGIIEVSAPKAEVFSRPAEPHVQEIQPEEIISNGHGSEEPPAPSSYAEKADLGTTISMPPLNVEELRTHEESSSEAPSESVPRAPIVLPDIGTTGNFAPIEAVKHQRAPLAMTEEESAQASAKSLLNMLPSIDVGEESEPSSLPSKSILPNRSGLKSVLPSLSGELRPIQEETDDSGVKNTTSTPGAGSVATVSTIGATGAFAPVGNELLENIDPEDIYVEDADDSVYEEGFTETGAIAGPGYVEMPKSRVRNLFGRFRRKKDKTDEDPSTRKWLNVDENFDARSAGAARGDWESFQKDQPYYENREKNEFSDDDEWEGGALNTEENYDLTLSEEAQRIHQFRHGGIDTEVWFVALGSELANNGGMKAFLQEHEQDLRGSIFINLCGLGAGTLSFVQTEGWRGNAKASSRIKRYLKKASQASGVSIDAGMIRWKQSAATVAADKGLQAMTIVGLDGDKPAFFAQGDDVLENIDEGILSRNIDFVMELIKSI